MTALALAALPFLSGPLHAYTIMVGYSTIDEYSIGNSADVDLTQYHGDSITGLWVNSSVDADQYNSGEADASVNDWSGTAYAGTSDGFTHGEVNITTSAFAENGDGTWGASSLTVETDSYYPGSSADDESTTYYDVYFGTDLYINVSSDWSSGGGGYQADLDGV